MAPDPDHRDRRRALQAGVAVFDSDAAATYSRVRARLDDGRTVTAELYVEDPRPPRRVTLSLADARAPLRVDLPPVDGEVARAYLEWRVSSPMQDLGPFASARFGFGVEAFGVAPGGVWFAGIPDDWVQLAVATTTGRVARIDRWSDGAPSAAWEPAAPPVDLDVAAYLMS